MFDLARGFVVVQGRSRLVLSGRKDKGPEKEVDRVIT
jgi:hypothetical protein